MDTCAPLPCTAQKKSGEPCSLWSLPGDKFCYFHSPKAKAGRLKACALGGSHTMKPKVLPNTADYRLNTAKDVKEMLESVSNHVLRGSLTPRQAQVISQLANVSLKAIESTQIEARLGEVERRLAAAAPRGQANG